MSRFVLFLVLLPVVALLAAFVVFADTGGTSFNKAEQAAFSFDPTGGPQWSGWRALPLTIPDGLHGPFGRETVRRSVSTPSPPDNIRLSLILIDENDKVAVINNTMVREGGAFAGMTVAAVEKNRVALIRNGVTQWVHLQE